MPLALIDVFPDYLIVSIGLPDDCQGAHVPLRLVRDAGVQPLVSGVVLARALVWRARPPVRWLEVHPVLSARWYCISVWPHSLARHFDGAV